MATQRMFDRKWKIVLEIKEKRNGQLITTDSHVIRDLKVTFAITNTLLGDPSLATFQLYNISNRSITLLTSEKCHISFYAGYHSDIESSWPRVFIGEVTNSYDLRQQTDIVWNVWARGNSSLFYDEKPTLASIQQPTSPKVILERLTTDCSSLANRPSYIGDAGSKLLNAPNEPEFNVTGSFSREFDDLLEPLGLGWTIQGNELLVFNKEITDPTELDGEAISISTLSGLLTIPVVDYVGVKFNHLLNGRLQPASIIDIEPNTVKYNLGNEFYVQNFDKEKWSAGGKFRVYEVSHKGDTRGDRWQTSVTAFYRRS